jgi:hypothetical protein
MKRTWINVLFYITAFYDGLLGVYFLFFSMSVYDAFGVTRPNHTGYVQFPALLLIIFGFMFLRIAREPSRYRELMWYGMGLKAAYSGVVLFHLWFGEGMPSMWVPFAVIDVAFLILMFLAWKVSGKREPATA